MRSAALRNTYLITIKWGTLFLTAGRICSSLLRSSDCKDGNIQCSLLWRPQIITLRFWRASNSHFYRAMFMAPLFWHGTLPGRIFRTRTLHSPKLKHVYGLRWRSAILGVYRYFTIANTIRLISVNDACSTIIGLWSYGCALSLPSALTKYITRAS